MSQSRLGPRDGYYLNPMLEESEKFWEYPQASTTRSHVSKNAAYISQWYNLRRVSIYCHNRTI
jgi:hypothetical protein